MDSRFGELSSFTTVEQLPAIFYSTRHSCNAKGKSIGVDRRRCAPSNRFQAATVGCRPDTEWRVEGVCGARSTVFSLAGRPVATRRATLCCALRSIDRKKIESWKKGRRKNPLGQHITGGRSRFAGRSSKFGHLEIFSSSRPLVRGPIKPIASMTISIAPAMKTNTPVVPNSFNTEAIKNAVKIAEKRLHE